MSDSHDCIISDDTPTREQQEARAINHLAEKCARLERAFADMLPALMEAKSALKLAQLNVGKNFGQETIDRLTSVIEQAKETIP